MEDSAETVAARDRRQAERYVHVRSMLLVRFERDVDRANALVYEAVGRLSRDYPEHAISGAASEDLRRIRPQLEGALTALAGIEQRRGLTQRELSHQRAFKMLLQAPRAG